MEDRLPQCALCPHDWPERSCHHETGKAPKNCPTVRHRDLAEQSISDVQSEQVYEFAKAATIVEGEGYTDKEKGYGAVRPIRPRILEVIAFAKQMRYERVALIFCIGLRKEAAVVHQIFERHGLHVLSVACKVGRASKDVLAITEDQKVAPGSDESMCNPILQAKLANRYRSQFNVLLGLCVGHDSLFFKHADAPSTVLAVKDRVLAHNPLAAVYQSESYYRYTNHPDDP